MEIERRTFAANIENLDQTRSVKGYASVFDRESQDLGGFVEIIHENAFTDRLNDDVRALFNHDANLILGRTTSGTLNLFVDNGGLGYEVDFPDTTYANDLLKSVKRGDVTQSSFAFTVAKDGDEWITEGDKIIRIVHRVAQLYDVSPVTYPAYTDATAAARSLKEYVKTKASATERRAVLERIRSHRWAD
jgi:HK97 family phage prohead protease